MRVARRAVWHVRRRRTRRCSRRGVQQRALCFRGAGRLQRDVSRRLPRSGCSNAIATNLRVDLDVLASARSSRDVNIKALNEPAADLLPPGTTHREPRRLARVAPWRHGKFVPRAEASSSRTARSRPSTVAELGRAGGRERGASGGYRQPWTTPVSARTSGCSTARRSGDPRKRTTAAARAPDNDAKNAARFGAAARDGGGFTALQAVLSTARAELRSGVRGSVHWSSRRAE